MPSTPRFARISISSRRRLDESRDDDDDDDDDDALRRRRADGQARRDRERGRRAAVRRLGRRRHSPALRVVRGDGGGLGRRGREVLDARGRERGGDAAPPHPRREVAERCARRDLPRPGGGARDGGRARRAPPGRFAREDLPRRARRGARRRRPLVAVANARGDSHRGRHPDVGPRACHLARAEVADARRRGDVADVSRERGGAEARSVHWFPYDRVGVVNAVP
ncbi:uncharacterized protein MICPUCDRAFT_62989 [Micromonas pusilla CCMP1545]|uniref:Predicted protein n=1 Tax=Micromonas pusilla (strain CCMP1545) TaxID=564608 RepID=C1N109_MICPC|nr:uncharacterized protein MICPUCDRAFT_62989 [Micromonas pusilla CCMP1545]EEH54356.1 predicted protein [Micromonas pusilla CCMP1545]|eukprot:XP_003061726.1 predicted protein [Micromonas pusilla CCMP1545]